MREIGEGLVTYMDVVCGREPENAIPKDDGSHSSQVTHSSLEFFESPDRHRAWFQPSARPFACAAVISV